MRLIFYLFLISQLLNFIGVFADKVREDSSELNSIKWEKLEENKSTSLKKLSGDPTRMMNLILKIKNNKVQ